ncbi:MAG: DNA-binding response regulator [Planctomyces sp.]|nr:DNA-binding response regulator [Planctomyces sp.]
MRILVVEDEEAIAEGLKFNFEQEGYEVVVAPDGQLALTVLKECGRDGFDLIVLDLMLPGLSGYEVLRELRQDNVLIPVLVLSARTLSEDKILAFDLGSDQYMTKPFALRELLSRVKSLIDRRQAIVMAAANAPATPLEGTAAPIIPIENKPEPKFQFGKVTVNFQTFQVHVGDRVHSLTTLELELLKYFIEHEGEVLSRTRILNHVWDEHAEVTTRTIDNFVLRLRKLIEPDTSKPSHILSVRGTGYRFVATPSPQADAAEDFVE